MSVGLQISQTSDRKWWIFGIEAMPVLRSANQLYRISSNFTFFYTSDFMLPSTCIVDSLSRTLQFRGFGIFCNLHPASNGVNWHLHCQKCTFVIYCTLEGDNIASYRSIIVSGKTWKTSKRNHSFTVRCLSATCVKKQNKTKKKHSFKFSRIDQCTRRPALHSGVPWDTYLIW